MLVNSGEFLILIYFVIVIAIFIIYINIVSKVRNKIYMYKDIETVNREIDCKYNPSIVSILFDNKLNSNDLVADIMNLYAKKYLKIEKKKKKKF